jgi:hypothetical protein
MDDKQRHRIMREARETVDRLNAMAPTEPRDPAAPDVIKEWKRHMPKPEPKRRERGLDTAPVGSSSVIDQRVASMKDFVMTVLGEALCATFDIERGAYIDALKERDSKIARLEVELAKLAVQTSKLEVRVIQNEIEHDRSKVLDLPALPKELN